MRQSQMLPGTPSCGPAPALREAAVRLHTPASDRSAGKSGQTPVLPSHPSSNPRTCTGTPPLPPAHCSGHSGSSPAFRRTARDPSSPPAPPLRPAGPAAHSLRIRAAETKEPAVRKAESRPADIGRFQAEPTPEESAAEPPENREKPAPPA